jgi:5-formyltetrahydrofolate cyclo-ligase
MPDLTGDAESRASKIALRHRLITERRSLSRLDLAAAAAAVQGQTLALVRRTAPAVVAAYVPVGSEPGGPALPSLLAAVVPRVLLPVLQPSGDLDWAAYQGALVRGPRGLLEPPGPRLGVDAVRSAGLVLVPALAVDRHGMRMGRGGGSYDRVLERLSLLSAGPRIVALLHSGELLDDAVPAEPHDHPVHAVIIPGGLVTLDSPLSRGPEWTK